MSSFFPHCSKCRAGLQLDRDTRRSGLYWKNCQRCRDKRNTLSRRKRGLPPVCRDGPYPGNTPRQVTGSSATSSMDYATPLDFPRSLLQKTDVIQNRQKSKTYASTDEAPGARVIECSVCGDPFSSTRFPSLQRCTHKPGVCQGCFSDWLASQVRSTSWNRIECPCTGCGALINHDEMKQFASAETYTRYDELSTRSVLSAIPNFRHCLRSGCSSGQIHDSGVEGNIFRCVACSFLVCITHDEAFHAGETCDEYDKRKSCRRKVEDDASAEKIQSTTKQCPGKACGVRIEKDSGCDHMTCRWCKHEFCWRCLAPYRGPRGIVTVSNSMHDRKCMYWRDSANVLTGDTVFERLRASVFG